jgi:hypothetical protein
MKKNCSTDLLNGSVNLTDMSVHVPPHKLNTLHNTQFACRGVFEEFVVNNFFVN